MTIRNLPDLLGPHSVVLVGASPEPGTIGQTVTRNLFGGTFRGPVHLVNPRHQEIEGRACHASIADLPETPALAVVATPPATVPDVIAALGAKGCCAAVVITAGLDRELRQRMLDAARPRCLRILGPNCLGLMAPHLGLNASFAHRPASPGDLVFLSQSGALVTAIVDWAGDRNVGFSHVVSLGDMADVDFGDLLDYFAGDTGSRAILLYMEALTHAPKFISAARRAARVKPVIVVKAGRHEAGAKAALSHTGALTGSDAAYEAAFRRTGLLRVGTMHELFDAAEMLSRQPSLAGERLMILTNGGGAGVLAADALAAGHGELAPLSDTARSELDGVLPPAWSRSNPVDIIGDAGPERYRRALEALLREPETDAILVINCPTALASSTAAANAIIETLSAPATRAAPKPVLATWLGEGVAREARQRFAREGIASFETPDSAITGFLQLVRHRRAQAELARTPPAFLEQLAFDRGAAQNVIDRARNAGRTVLSAAEAKAVLDAYGIPVAKAETAADPEQVRGKAEAILREHQACVLKILSDDISHKSDVGGVRLGIESAAQAEMAARDMLDRIRRAMPDARIAGFTIEPMVHRPRAHELIVGMSEDATFGPMLLFGAGGTAVEVLKDTALALPPLDLNLARELMRQTRIHRLLEGYRDRPRADLDAVAGCLVRTSMLITQHPEIRELDINPLLADETGVVALDARMRIASPAEPARRPLAIRPYPAQWERRYEIAGLGSILLRPIRPEDERLYERFMAGVTADDRRLRFFSPRPDLSHRFLARLTQIDYAREMAFVALAAGSGELLGVVRLVADPDYTRAEFAIMVRSYLKGRGLGSALLRQLIDYARQEGLGECSDRSWRRTPPCSASPRSSGSASAWCPARRACAR